MKLLDLFSGIGGFSLGLERAGFQTVAFCEIEPFCRDVIRKHWPDVPIYNDVRLLTAETLRADGISVDAICGGFPCQDISQAGKGAGIEGSRSGLWSEYARLIGELRPRVVIVENVSALRNRGLDRVLGEMAALGYDAEWHCIPASAVGAPHRRDRIWIVANDAQRRWCCEQSEVSSTSAQGKVGGCCGKLSVVADPNGNELRDEPRRGCGANGSGARQLGDDGAKKLVADANSEPAGRLAISWGECGQWLVESDVGRVAHGVPARVHRLRALGNAVVPQIPEIIGRAIILSER